MLHLQRQIDRLKKQLLTVGAMVEEQVAASIDAVQHRDVEAAEKVIAGDRRIDLTELEVEEECLHSLALYQPVANDLRYIIAVLKINHDLERIGDLAASIAQQAISLASEAETEVVPFDLPGMSSRVEQMLRRSLDALVNLDTAEARAVRKLDDEVDEIHATMYDRVSKLMREHPHQLEQYISYMSISAKLERIADHAVNIAKDVLYMVEGEIVRHRGAREAIAKAE